VWEKKHKTSLSCKKCRKAALWAEVVGHVYRITCHHCKHVFDTNSDALDRSLGVKKKRGQ
jgi:phage FluMu protein Com